MEDILEVYHRPYDPDYPVVCMDESSKQLVADVVTPIPASPGKPKRIEYEYIRKGVAQIFLATEPLTGALTIHVKRRRTSQDWAEFIKHLLDNCYPDAKKMVLVMDNLNTHGIASLYATFAPAEALRLASRLEIHYTPKNGSWLNVAEIEFSALSVQCLDRRFEDKNALITEIAAWEAYRNARRRPVNWQFKTADARIKLKGLYPQI